MKEGERLRRLLEAKRYEQAELAEKAGVSKTAVGKWLRVGRFSDRTWKKLKPGLIKLGLKPHDVRPGEREAGPQEDLTLLVDTWTHEQLLAVKRILVSDDDSKEHLMSYIKGAVRKIT